MGLFGLICLCKEFRWLKQDGSKYLDKALGPEYLDFGNQYLCFIGWFSPFLRASSGKKSRSISNFQ
ncbi:MAG: hypothetical protein B7Y24_14700 [Sphingobacteriales bacterium 16-39-50]|nr:MAG: hypothetical protein B7Y24_14700 [Sphingobacteriales bacterium 16-39-50]